MTPRKASKPRTVTLLPCPFCGGSAEAWHIVGAGVFNVACRNPRESSPLSTAPGCGAEVSSDGPRKVVRLWNRRTGVLPKRRKRT